jgi:gas vesicle protein
MSIRKIAAGAITGTAFGVLLGVLFAPEKGSDTRKKNAKKSADTVDDLKRKFEKLIDGVKEKFEDGKEEVLEANCEVKTNVEEFSNDSKTV